MNVVTETGVPSQRGKTLKLSWVGQMLASLCWIASVFVYGEFAVGDWIQLAAAASWAVANVAAVLESD